MPRTLHLGSLGQKEKSSLSDSSSPLRNPANHWGWHVCIHGLTLFVERTITLAAMSSLELGWGLELGVPLAALKDAACRSSMWSWQLHLYLGISWVCCFLITHTEVLNSVWVSFWDLGIWSSFEHVRKTWPF